MRKTLRYLCMMMAVCSIFAACFFARCYIEKPNVSGQTIEAASYESQLKNLGASVPTPLAITLSWGHMYMINIFVFCVLTLGLILIEVKAVEDYYAYPVYCITVSAGLGFTLFMSMSTVLPFLPILKQLGATG